MSAVGSYLRIKHDLSKRYGRCRQIERVQLNTAHVYVPQELMESKQFDQTDKKKLLSGRKKRA